MEKLMKEGETAAGMRDTHSHCYKLYSCWGGAGTVNVFFYLLVSEGSYPVSNFYGCSFWKKKTELLDPLP